MKENTGNNMMSNIHGGNIYGIERDYGIPAGDIIDFSVNLNPLGTPPAIKKIISDNLDEIMRYPDPEYVECRKSIGLYHGLPYGNITAGNGATELIFLYCRATKPGRALVVAPDFSEYSRALLAAGAETGYFALKEENGFNADIDSLRREISRGYDLVVICNPNNPAGTLIRRDDMVSLAEHAMSSGCRVLLDESFIEFTAGGTGDWSLAGEGVPRNTFIIRSLTKIFSLPGLRIGYGISSDSELNRKLAEMREPWSVNVLAAKCANYLPESSEYLDSTRRTVSEENRFLVEKLKEFGWLKIFMSPVNYMVLKILNGMTSSRLSEELLKKNIMVRDASNFRFLDDRFIRIAVKDRMSNRLLVNALRDFTAENGL